MLDFLGRLFGISKYPQRPELSEETKNRAKIDLELRDKILPLSREQLDNTGFALTGAALKNYNHAKATYYKDSELPDKTPDGVQSTLIGKTLDGLAVAHEAAIARLNKEQPAVPDEGNPAASL